MDGNSSANFHATRRYGSPPWRAAVLHGGPGARGSVAIVARELGKTVGTLEPIQSQNTIDGLVDELCKQLSAFANEPLVLIGHSWGAWLAMLFAARYPGSARRLVLVGSGPLLSEYGKLINERRQARLTPEQWSEFLSALAASHDASAGREAAMSRVAALTSLSDNFHPHSAVSGEERDALSFDAEQYAAIWPEAERLRADGGLLRAARSLRCPVTVLHGEDDPHPVDGVVAPLHSIGVKADVRVFPRCGHYPFREVFAAEDFFAALRLIVSS